MGQQAMYTELYDRLGVEPCATDAQIRKAYRSKAKTAHPDQGGNEEEFAQLSQAFEILINPESRKRYDSTGRMDEDKITPNRIREFIRNTIRTVVEAERPDGSADDPRFEDIRNKIILSLRQARGQIQNNLFKSQRKLERAQRIYERFRLRPLSDQSFDPVGDALKEELKRLREEINSHDDAKRLSEEAEKTLDAYLYEMGPGPEGQYSPGPTHQRTLLGVDARSGLRIFPNGG